jgi:hypothetical protein
LFFITLEWSYNREGIKLVDVTTIEQATNHIRAVFSRYLEDDDDSLVEIFCSIWKAVKANYPGLWGKDNQFMTKVNINALNEFLTERLKLAYEMGLVNIFESKDVERSVLSMLRPLPKEFWEAEWTIKIQDNANVRKLIKEDLEVVMENSKLKRHWNEDLKLVETAI